MESNNARDLKRRLDELRVELATIEGHLADKNRTSATGNRLTNEQYHSWRKNAIRAHATKTEQVREIKKGLAEFRRSVLGSAIDADPDNPQDLLTLCYQAHEAIKSRIGIDSLEPSEVLTFDLVRDYVLAAD